jgi:hypothetical protein
VGGPSAYWQNLYDKDAEWGPAFFDAAHSFQGSFLYELPFGTGKAFGSGWNEVANGVLGGWQLSGILYLRSGFAMTVRGRDVTATGSRGSRADRIGDGTDGPRTVGPGGEWFDTSAYVNPEAGSFGNAGNGTFRGPGLTNLDLSLQKNFGIAESMRLQFRAEAFNVSNTPAFQGVERNVTSATFGELTGSQGERRYQLGLKFLF